MQLPSMKALTAVATNSRMISVLTTTLMTLRRPSHFWLFQPMVWNMDQKPWLRWSQMAMNQTM